MGLSISVPSAAQPNTAQLEQARTRGQEQQAQQAQEAGRGSRGRKARRTQNIDMAQDPDSAVDTGQVNVDSDNCSQAEIKEELSKRNGINTKNIANELLKIALYEKAAIANIGKEMDAVYKAAQKYLAKLEKNHSKLDFDDASGKITDKIKTLIRTYIDQCQSGSIPHGSKGGHVTLTPAELKHVKQLEGDLHSATLMRNQIISQATTDVQNLLGGNVKQLDISKLKDIKNIDTKDFGRLLNIMVTKTGSEQEKTAAELEKKEQDHATVIAHAKSISAFKAVKDQKAAEKQAKKNFLIGAFLNFFKDIAQVAIAAFATFKAIGEILVTIGGALPMAGAEIGGAFVATGLALVSVADTAGQLGVFYTHGKNLKEAQGWNIAQGIARATGCSLKKAQKIGADFDHVTMALGIVAAVLTMGEEAIATAGSIANKVTSLATKVASFAWKSSESVDSAVLEETEEVAEAIENSVGDAATDTQAPDGTSEDSDDSDSVDSGYTSAEEPGQESTDEMLDETSDAQKVESEKTEKAEVKNDKTEAKKRKDKLMLVKMRMMKTYLIISGAVTSAVTTYEDIKTAMSEKTSKTADAELDKVNAESTGNNYNLQVYAEMLRNAISLTEKNQNICADIMQVYTGGISKIAIAIGGSR